jgi:tetratricopeptide (TPR) repeat protein
MSKQSLQHLAAADTSAWPQFMATNEVLTGLESALAKMQATGDDQQLVSALVTLGWHVRQRETQRALSLVDEAERRLQEAELPAGTMGHLRARIRLIQGEASWLYGELDQAMALGEKALEDFEAQADEPAKDVGCADAHWLISVIAYDKGNEARSDAELAAVVACASNIDRVRMTMAQASLARYEAFRDIDSAKVRWGPLFGELEMTHLHPVAAAAVANFLGLVARKSNDYVQAIRHRSNVYSLALSTGLPRQAMIAAVNIGTSFDNLNDYQTGLEWLQRALSIARAAGWPQMTGMTLMQVGEILRELKHLDAAADTLHEALTLMTPTGSRAYASALRYLADVEFDRKNFAPALESFRQLERLSAALSQPDQVSQALRGQARTLLELGEPAEALKAAQAALVAAHSDAFTKMLALRTLADIHTRHNLPAPDDLCAASVPLHYLLQTLELAANVKNYTVPGDLLETAAREHARLGNLQEAYALALQANQAFDKVRSKEAHLQALAMQIRYETEKARNEAEHQRLLAQAHAQRVQMLEQLGAIGREITGNLQAGAIYAVLDKHLRSLLDVTALRIHLLDARGTTLTLAYGTPEGDMNRAPDAHPDDDATAAMERCILEREVVVDFLGGDEPSTPPCPGEPLSRMTAPLLVGERAMGAMSIECDLPNAYAEREIAIFQTLCAYGAIALVNADSQAQLVEKNRQLEVLSNSDRLTGLLISP